MWVGTINYDYNAKDGLDTNQYQRIGKALEKIGWQYSDTSAFTLETSDYKKVSLTFELLARSTHTAGQVSAITVAIQMIGNRTTAGGSSSPENAFKTLMQMPLPSSSM
ncbi:hypothetical protein [Rhodococcoides fascians]|uniref:hypothetical protein n=1 Tax=Rhodococcoides fascians TaxID=1828 RepID=UPI0037BD05B4